MKARQSATAKSVAASAANPHRPGLLKPAGDFHGKMPAPGVNPRSWIGEILAASKLLLKNKNPHHRGVRVFVPDSEPERLRVNCPPE